MSRVPEEVCQLIERAEKLTKKKSSFFGIFGNNQESLEEASELYNKAGNLLKAERLFKEAASAFLASADLDEKIGEDNLEEAARKRVSAVSCLRKIDAAAAIEQLEKAIKVYLSAGRFHMVANYEKEAAEIWEHESNWQAAATCYQKAAKRFEAENSPAMSQGCLQKAALALGWLGQWDESARIFEQIGEECASDSLRKYGAREHYFCSLLGRLAAGDLVGAGLKIDWLEKGRERQLIQQVIGALEEADEDKFTQAVGEFDKVANLDDWKSNCLLTIKKYIDTEPSLA